MIGSLALYAITFACWRLVGVHVPQAAFLSLLPFIGVLLGMQDLSRVGTWLLVAATAGWLVIPLIVKAPDIPHTEALIAQSINASLGGGGFSSHQPAPSNLTLRRS